MCKLPLKLNWTFIRPVSSIAIMVIGGCLAATPLAAQDPSVGTPKTEVSTPSRLDLELVAAEYEPLLTHPLLGPEHLSFSLVHNRPDLAGSEISIEVALDAYPLSESAYSHSDEPLALGAFQALLELKEGTQLINLFPRHSGSFRFPAGTTGSYRLEMTLFASDFVDPKPDNNRIELNGVVEVKDSSPPLQSIFSHQSIPNTGIVPLFSQGIELNDTYANNWRTRQPFGYLSMKWEAAHASDDELTIRHLIATAPDCPPPTHSPIAVLVNGQLIATEMSVQPQSPSSPWTETKFTVKTQEGTNFIELLHGKSCSDLWLQGIFIAPQTAKALTNSHSNFIPIAELEANRLRPLTALAAMHVNNQSLEHGESLLQLVEQSPALKQDLEWQKEQLHARAWLASYQNDPEAIGRFSTQLLNNPRTEEDSIRQLEGQYLLAISFEEQNEYSEAIEAYKACINLKPSNHELLADIYKRLVTQYFITGQFMMARALALETLEVIPQSVLSKDWVRHLMLKQVATLDPMKGLLNPTGTTSAELKKAINGFLKNPVVLMLLATISDHPIGQFYQTFTRAAEHFFEKDYANAKLAMLEALEPLQSTSYHELIGLLQVCIAGTDIRMHNWKEATEHLNQATGRFSRAFESIKHPLVLASSNSLSFAAYFELMRCYHELNQPYKSLHALEVGHARTLFARLQANSAPGGSPESLTAPESYFTLENISSESFLQREIESIVSDIPEGRSVKFIEFVLGDEVSNVFVITPQSNAPPEVQAVRLKANRPAIRNLITRMRTRIINDSILRESREARSLYTLLLAPIQEHLDSITENDLLCIIPDDALWKLPFGALIGPRGALGDLHPISLAPSLRVMAQLRSRQRESTAAPTLALIAPEITPDKEASTPAYLEDLTPIEGTETMVQQLSQLGASQIKMKLASEASETYLKQHAQNASALLFVTHGIYREYSPEETGIFLTRDAKNDGFLSVLEILELNLDIDLAFIAACHSGRGTSTPGEGALGLAWALLAAGSQSNLVALYEVETTNTFDLVSRFHNRYRELKSSNHPFAKAQALFESRREIAENSERDHPFFLDGFVITGDWQ